MASRAARSANSVTLHVVIVRDGSAGVERVGLALLAGCTCLTTSFLSIYLLAFFFESHTNNLTIAAEFSNFGVVQLSATNVSPRA